MSTSDGLQYVTKLSTLAVTADTLHPGLKGSWKKPQLRSGVGGGVTHNTDSTLLVLVPVLLSLLLVLSLLGVLAFLLAG